MSLLMDFHPVQGTMSDPYDRFYWFSFKGDQILVQVLDGITTIPLESSTETKTTLPFGRHLFGKLNGIPCLLGEHEDEQDNAEGNGRRWVPVRSLILTLEEEWFMLVGRAYQIMTWLRDHRFCSRCGTRTEESTDERTMECPECNAQWYPRISPAMIVSILRDDRILLARSSRFRSDFFSVLAGFVEPGESLEDCVHREVMEEVGISVQNVRYVASQSWPFPHSLMVGFTAEYARGEIEIDENEILEAGWFRSDELPQVPGRFSISGRLIRDFVESQ